jgi:lipoprotein-anchoring transpeptidase ErfK/SrfK
VGAGVAGALKGRQRVGLIRALACVALLLAAGNSAAADYWIRVDTAQRLLEVRDGERVLQTMENISLGRNGVSVDKAIHDRTTPLGSYRVRRINEESRFLIYFGFDYPTLDQAQRAFRAGRISYDQLKAIRRAHYLGQEPPANTPLGGLIGIHGLGEGDPGIHEDFDWTDGCIALTNEQALELARWVHLGTRVEVQ